MQNHAGALNTSPHDAQSIAKRSLALSAVVCRVNLERFAGQREPEALRQQVLEWVDKLELWDDLEPTERRTLQAALGSLDYSVVLRSSWHVEGLAILSWSLKYSKFPPLDRKVDPHEVTDSLWFLNDDAQDIISTAELRPTVQIDAARELLYAIHVRVRDYNRNKNKVYFPDYIEESWLTALKIDRAQIFAQDDLAICGKTFDMVSEEQLHEFECIINERHRAIIWLTEEYPSYSGTPVDT